MSDIKDPYRILGVSKGDPDDVLRKAYRKLARQYHPDVNPGDKAAEDKFKEVSSAYDVLGDPKKRKLYDEFGPIGLREGFDADKARAYGRAPPGMGGGWGPTGPGGAGAEFDLGDLFGDLFGGGGGRRRSAARGRDVLVRVEISFAEALRGTEVKLNLAGQGACKGCAGKGKIGGPRGNACTLCGGSGQAGGAGPFTVRIPKGADQGSKLRVSGRGEAGPGGSPAGDLIIEMQVKAHPYFSREGLDLLLRLPISLAEAYCGATVSVPTPSGEVALKVPARSQPATRLRLRERGVQRGSQTGDMLVELDVRLPDKDDAALASALNQAAGAYSRPLRENLSF